MDRYRGLRQHKQGDAAGIEVVQEEAVREVLRDVRIIERLADSPGGICIARAALRRASSDGSASHDAGKPSGQPVELSPDR